MESSETKQSEAISEEQTDSSPAPTLAERLSGTGPAAFLAEISALPDGEATQRLAELGALPGGEGLPVLALAAQQGRAALALAAINVLATVRRQEAADALAAIGAGRADRDKSKAARKALYKLSLAGLKPAALPAAPQPAEPEAEKVYASLATYVDPTGSHSFYVVRQNRFGTLSLAVFVVSEEKGVSDAYGAIPCSLSLWKRQLNLLAERDIATVPVGLAFIRQQLEIAEARNSRSHTPLPQDYWPLTRLVRAPDGDETAPAEMAPDAIRGNADLLASSRELLKKPAFEGWFFGFDEARPYALRVIADERRRQQLGTTEEQNLPVADLGRVQREGTTVSVALSELVDGARRSQIQERLEYTAELLWRAGDLQAAKEARAAALALAPDSNLPIEQHPLLRDMMNKSLSMAVELEQATGSATDAGRAAGAPPPQVEQAEESVDEQGFIRRKSGLILPK